ncbi:MAG: phosphate acyltransferase PlsX [Chloroflexales bacterium]|nr:phosphate acyltransferase PlsX [Chloroflexales bacterium]
MRIVLDTMGGDQAPQAQIKGAVQAARAYGCTVILVGPQDRIAAELARYDTTGLDLPIVDAPDSIGMEEHPAQAVRRKLASSHVVGLRLVRDGQADAFVSAGHSGATMAGALFVLGRLSNIDRPALAGFFPTLDKPVLVLDMGATTDCKPEYLLQFAQIGSVYAERAMGVRNPRIALLSNGEEANKGNKLVQEAHALLRESTLNFVGNAEPKDLLINKTCDVLVTDGFSGNLILKMGEAVVSFGARKIRNEFRRRLVLRVLLCLSPTLALAFLPGRGRWRGPVGALFGGLGLVAATLVPLLRVQHEIDYRAYGGVPLLGVKGVTIITHGKADAYTIQNAIRQADEVARAGIIAGMAAALEPASVNDTTNHRGLA